ncbi:hypothetical protein Tco_0625543 [Tanacetum coccineum]|uniref:Uncharacterized protein n=1 Tax=Tanacetum coccineum TaxID=301880 RepID=A0ABQ4WH53_9ASTR
MIRSWPGTVVRCRGYLVRCVEVIWVCPIVNALAGRLLGAYDLKIVTLRAVVHGGDKTSRDARSWYMIKPGNAKSFGL